MTTTTAAAALSRTTLLVAAFAVFCAMPQRVEAFVPKDAGRAATPTTCRFTNGLSDLVPWRRTMATSSVPSTTTTASIGSPTSLRMGLFDKFLSRFGDNQDEEGDFVKLDQMNDQFTGPGPVVLLYKVPEGIDNDEVLDMLSDGAPQATKKGISIARIASTENKKVYSLDTSDNDTANNNDLIDMSLQEALEAVMKRPPQKSTSTRMAGPPSSGSPVVIFSGFANHEMMDSYNILGEEIYKEGMSAYGRGQFLACATAVPNAMDKPLRQVLDEISGDHADAMAARGPPA